MRRWALGAVAGWLLLAGASLFLRRVVGESMCPTLEPGDVVLVLPVREEPPIGAVVTLPDPRGAQRETIKRVVAVAGDLTDLGGEVATVPPGQVAVRGDAVAGSTDSRHYGPVDATAVGGRVVARLWPHPTRIS